MIKKRVKFKINAKKKQNKTFSTNFPVSTLYTARHDEKHRQNNELQTKRTQAVNCRTTN